MVRFRLMSRLGLVEPLVRWQRRVERAEPRPAPPPDRSTKATTPHLAVRPR